MVGRAHDGGREGGMEENELFGADESLTSGGRLNNFYITVTQNPLFLLNH